RMSADPAVPAERGCGGDLSTAQVFALRRESIGLCSATTHSQLRACSGGGRATRRARASRPRAAQRASQGETHMKDPTYPETPTDRENPAKRVNRTNRVNREGREPPPDLGGRTDRASRATPLPAETAETRTTTPGSTRMENTTPTTEMTPAARADAPTTA